MAGMVSQLGMGLLVGPGMGLALVMETGMRGKMGMAGWGRVGWGTRVLLEQAVLGTVGHSARLAGWVAGWGSLAQTGWGVESPGLGWRGWAAGEAGHSRAVARYCTVGAGETRWRGGPVPPARRVCL